MARRDGRGANLGSGRGLGQRRGLGRNIEFEQDNTHKEFLKQQKQILEDKLELIKEELENL